MDFVQIVSCADHVLSALLLAFAAPSFAAADGWQQSRVESAFPDASGLRLCQASSQVQL